MPTFKNITVKKRGGGTRLQRVKVLASGKYKFVKNLGKKVTKSKSSNPSPSKKARKVKRKMAKKKRRRSARTIPLAPVLGLVGGFVVPNKFGFSVYSRAMEGNWEAALHVAIMNYTGYNPDDGSWNLLDARGLWTALAGFAAHKVAGMLGVNRVLGRAKVPLIRI